MASRRPRIACLLALEPVYAPAALPYPSGLHGLYGRPGTTAGRGLYPAGPAASGEPAGWQGAETVDLQMATDDFEDDHTRFGHEP